MLGRSVDRAATPFTIAIMQPYFLPYAGYFRLFAATDLFVIYDCVQFPRRGWVHRNRLIDTTGVERWLTLPLEKAPQNVLIRDLQFQRDATRLFAERLRLFPLVTENSRAVGPIIEALYQVQGSPLDYIERLLEHVVTYLGLRWRVIRSSTLDVPPEICGQDRIVEIARRLGASRYLNLSGGRDLYRPDVFEQASIDLRFLRDYPGPFSSILTRILHENPDEIAQDIRATSRYEL